MSSSFAHCHDPAKRKAADIAHTGNRFLVTGGSGFIGTNAIQHCLDAGHTVLNLDVEPPRDGAHHAYWRHCDILDPARLNAEIREFSPNFILHLAARTGMDAADASYFATNTDGTANLLAATHSAPDLQRLIVASSLLVCRNGHVPVSDTEYCPPNLYGESKVVTERLVRAAVDLPCPWTIVRPTSIWGPWFDIPYKTFFLTVARGLYMHPGSRRIVKPISFAPNTVHMMMKLAEAPAKDVAGMTFYMADWPEHAIREWATAIQKAVGATPIRQAPLWLLRLLGLGGDTLKAIGVMKTPPLTSFRLGNMLTGAHYPIEKTRAIVGKLPFGLDDGVEVTVDWLRRTGSLPEA